MSILTRVLMGYSRTLPADGGEGVSPPPPLSSKLMDQFSIWKRHLIASGLNFPNKFQNVIWTTLMTSQVGSKVIFLIFLIAHFAGQSSRVKKTDETTWIVSGILLSSLLSPLSPCDKSMSSKFTRSKKAKFKILGFGGAIYVFRSDLHQERKKWPWNTFRIAQIGQNVKIRKIPKSS